MERAFFCERGGREWAECSNVHVIQSDIEDVSVAFILHKDGNWQSGFKADALAYGRRNRISEWLEGDMAAAGLVVQPPKSVRRAYTYNPYAILWYLFFRKWGIEDPRYWQPFLRLDNCISGVRLDRFVYDRENKQIVYGDRYNRRRWEK